MYEEIELDTAIDPAEREDFLVAVAAVISADEVVLPVESKYLDELTLALGFTGTEPGLKSRVEAALSETKNLDDALKFILHPKLKRTLFRVLVSAAAVDGTFHRREAETLAYAGTALGLPEEGVRDYLDWSLRMLALKKELGTILPRLG